MAMTASAASSTCCRSLQVAFTSSCHHMSGSCSAHPVWGESIRISFSGEKATATLAPVSASSRQAFTEEEPMSYPNKYRGIASVFHSLQLILFPRLHTSRLPKHQHYCAKNDVDDPGPPVHHFGLVAGRMDDKRSDQQKDSHQHEEKAYHKTEIEN